MCQIIGSGPLCVKPSTPRTVTWPTGGSGSARIIRSSVDRLTPIPSRVASREPARPANAKQIASSAAWRPGLRRACRSVNPGTCSTKRARAAVDVVAEEPADRQPQFHRPARSGQIRQMASVPAVHPGSTSAHTGGSAKPGPVDARRSPPPRPPGRSGRSPPATDAETEPGNNTPPATAPRAPRQADWRRALNAAASASRKVGQTRLPRPTTE